MIPQKGVYQHKKTFCNEKNYLKGLNMRIKYLLIKCNLTLLTASGARDIQSTTTMLVSLVYFLSTQSNVGKYLTYRIPPTLPPPPPLTKVDDNQFLLWGGGAYIPKNNAKGAESLVFFLNRKMEVQNQIRGGK